MSKKNQRKADFNQDHQREEWREVDARVLGQILAAQNVIFALPSATRIAEFYSQTLLSIPGISACRVCLANQSIQTGDMEYNPCAECEALRRGSDPGTVIPANPDFKCGLIDRSDVRVIAIDSYQHHFGFFVFRIQNAAGFDVYHPFVSNLSNYVAITFENRLQKELLQKTHHELERRVEERTHDLTLVNAELQREITERTRAEEALHQSEEQVRQLIDASPVAMVVSSGTDERAEWVNDKFVELFGYTIEDMPDVEHWWPLAYPDETYREKIKAQWVADVDQAIRGKSQSEPMEATVRCKDGSRRHVEFRFSSIGEKHLVTFVDLTERKKAEDALRERESHSQSLRRLSRKLEQSQTYSEVLSAAQDEVRDVIGYKNLWAYLFTPDKKQAKALFAQGSMADKVMSEDGTATLTIEGDRMMEEMEEFVETKTIMVVEDAQTDERTNKQIAARMGNRTLINVPILLFDRHMGSVGTGTFGDEGVRVPTVSEQEYLTALASHMAVALDRIHLLNTRKRAEEELQRTNDLLRAIIEAAPTAIIGLDLEGNVQHVWNPAAEKMLGWSAKEVMGKFLPSVPMDKKVEFQKFREWVRSGKTMDGVEVQRQRRDGTFIDYSIYASPLHSPEGRIVGNVAVLVDITERKRVEDALRESEERYRQLVNLSPDGVSIHSHGRILFVNPAMAQMSRATSADQMIGKSVLDFVHPEFRDVVQKRIQEMEVTGQPIPFLEEKLLRFDGSSFHVELAAIPYTVKGTQYIQVVARDITERKQAEDALWKSSQMLKLVLDSMPAYVFWKDRNSVYLGCNNLFAANAGLKSPEEIAGLTDLDLPWKDTEAESYRADDKMVMETGMSKLNYEETQLTADGRVVAVRTSKIPLRNPDGDIIGVLGAFEDITEQKRAQEALRVSENRFRVLSENAFVGIYIIQEGRLSYVNSTLAKIFGYSSDELTGASPMLVIHPDDQAMVSENIRRRIAGEVETVHYEFRGRRKDGEIRNIEVLGGRVDLGGQPAIIGNLMDITDRKRAEEEIAHSLTAEKQARRVAEILREANESLSRALNLDDVLQNLLQSLMHLVPYDSANVMLREGDFQLRVVALSGYEHWTDLDAAQHLVFDIRTIPSLSKVLTTQKSLMIANTHEYPGWLRVPGTEHVVSWLGVPVIADGQVIGLYSVDKAEPGFFTEEHRLLAEGLAAQAAVAIQNTRLHDQITRANLELERRVASRTAQLEDANKELEAFAYSVSHDLRAPLRHIDGFIELLQKKTKVTFDDKSEHYMDVISSSAKQMGMLIDNLLSFSRMSRAEMFKSQVDLNELVQDVIREFMPEIEGRNIEWQISPLPRVTCDRAMLRAALVNLVSNALKFTHPRETPRIEIGCEKDDGTEVILFIRDNGVGFDMDYADKLFGVFQRLHRVDEFEGTGIGLANVRRIISRHGGRIWADGEVDRGATFYFSLPNSK